PARTFGVAMLFIVGVFVTYGMLGKGVEFFPKSEPDFAQVQIRARGDLSVSEKDAIVRQVEARIHGLAGIRTVYTRTIGVSERTGAEVGEDVIGTVTLEFVDWNKRRKADLILADIRKRVAVIPGIVVEIRKQQEGPSAGKPIQIELRGHDPKLLLPAIVKLRKALTSVKGLRDVEDTRSLPGIEWRLMVNREKAARYGADILVLGRIVQMVTNGIKVAEYRPNDAEEEVDIRLRFPHQLRNLDQLVSLRVPTAKGLIPIRNFVRFIPAPKTGTLHRTDSIRVLKINADVKEGVLVDAKLKEIKAIFAKVELAEGLTLKFKGQDEDQRRASNFLSIAFLIAVFLMSLILITQFNSVYQAFLVLSAIVLSTAGVLIGLMVAGEPFGIVMCGIGVIALAGIVVNNNIILIDTYNDMKRRGMDAREAILRTAAQRLRPVLLTAITTVLGLMPMVLSMNLDIVAREITFGAPSTQWWTQLSTSIAGGLSFATVLTLIVTPCLLILGENIGAAVSKRIGLKRSAAFRSVPR
ncbi:MAG: efflux RND transporter permease subunit, partial [Alphaproteobacteria bacterium]